jgi:uncharacterized protein (TIGR02145 family)
LLAFSDKTGAHGIIKCQAPGASGISFSAFNPCPAIVGATWTLTDSRDQKKYKVKYMPDGRYWMVQDLMFGDKCNKTYFTGSTSNRTGNINSTGTYYGDCRNNPNTAGGYFYDWPAAVNHIDAYYGNASYMGCSGTTTAANSCQGICAAGWHLSTKDELQEVLQQMVSYWSCELETMCVYSYFEAYASGWVNASGQFKEPAEYTCQTSTSVDRNMDWNLSTSRTNLVGDSGTKNCGHPVRCIRNL